MLDTRLIRLTFRDLRDWVYLTRRNKATAEMVKYRHARSLDLQAFIPPRMARVVRACRKVRNLERRIRLKARILLAHLAFALYRA